MPMPHETSQQHQQQPQQQQQQRSDSDSTRRIALKIQGCIVRNAMLEEYRAQKALHLLKNRDQRIAYLESRVTELEEAAANLHMLTLNVSTTFSSSERSRESIFYHTPKREGSVEEFPCKLALELNSENITNNPNENIAIVPELNISNQIENPDRTSDSWNDRVTQMLKAKSLCVIDDRPKTTNCVDLEEISSAEEPETDMDEKMLGGRVDNARVRSDLVKSIEPSKDSNRSTDKIESANDCSDSSFPPDKRGKQQRVIVQAKRVKRNLATRTFSSVPSVLAHSRCTRRRNLASECSLDEKPKEGRMGDRRYMYKEATGPLEFISTSDQGDTDAEAAYRKKRMGRRVRNNREEDTTNPREIRVRGDPSKISDLRTIGTQTLEDVNSYKERANVKGSFSLPSCFYMEQRRSAMFWHSDDEPAPQWLIEEALNKGKEICTEYETTISKLQRELNQTKSQLKETIEQKDVTQYQFERALGNMKSEAEKQYEAMQEKIVDICTSILDKFQSSIIYDDTDYKHNRRAKHCGELSKNLRKKLQRNSKTLARMKTELRITRTALREKSESFETLNKWFVKLKLQLDTTEVSMRELLAENSLLHKKNEQSKECIECKTRKEPDDKNNPSLIKELQKSREIINLKKKAEEDNITITQLRNKLQRLESAHNNRGILLSNYKNQINDLEKGKDQHENKIKQLENENNNLRSTVVQLKSKASYLTKEKSKLLKDVQALQRKAEALNINYNNELIFMKNNLEISNNCNIEYYNAFKEFLMKMKSYEEKIDAIETTEKSDEGKGTITQNWKEDLRDIISQKSFASNLAEFLFQHLVSKNTS